MCACACARTCACACARWGMCVRGGGGHETRVQNVRANNECTSPGTARVREIVKLQCEGTLQECSKCKRGEGEGEEGKSEEGGEGEGHTFSSAVARSDLGEEGTTRTGASPSYSPKAPTPNRTPAARGGDGSASAPAPAPASVSSEPWAPGLVVLAPGPNAPGGGTLPPPPAPPTLAPPKRPLPPASVEWEMSLREPARGVPPPAEARFPSTPLPPPGDRMGRPTARVGRRAFPRVLAMAGER